MSEKSTNLQEEWSQPRTVPQDWMRAATVTVMPAAINPYSTALVTPANTTREILLGYRKRELATAQPPEVSLAPIGAKITTKPFRAVKPAVSRNTALA
jgi:hypothetical protein